MLHLVLLEVQLDELLQQHLAELPQVPSDAAVRAARARDRHARLVGRVARAVFNALFRDPARASIENYVQPRAWLRLENCESAIYCNKRAVSVFLSTLLLT